MKKAMKKIVALALSSMTALSVFAASASAAQYVSGYPSKDYSKWCSVCGEYHYGYTHDAYGGYYDSNGKWHSWDSVYDGYYYGYSYVTLTANQWAAGTISATVPTNATVKSYKWVNLTNIKENENYSGSSVTIKDKGPYSATCEVTFTYKVSSNRTVTDVVSVKISGTAYSTEYDAGIKNDKTNTNVGYSSYYPGYPYWPDYDYDNGFWYNGKWYSYSDGYWYDGKWYPYYPSYPSYSHRDEYTVDWSEDTYYYDGEKHVPTATVTVGKRTIELNVSLTSGNGIDVGRHRVVARVPSGYSGIKLDGASLYYNIEEPLKSGFVYEDGYTYYYEGGKAVTGWKTIDGDTYYFAKDGKATKGWKWLNNAWYYFGSDGKMMTEWVRDGGKIYYCYDSGVMAKSTWLKLDGYWYYFYNDGRMAESEWVLSGGKWYFLAGDGRMATNTTIPGGYYVDSTGAWVK